MADTTLWQGDPTVEGLLGIEVHLPSTSFSSERSSLYITMCHYTSAAAPLFALSSLELVHYFATLVNLYHN